MLIRSQDKETLVNIETSIVLYISGTIGKKYPISTSNGYAIGFYSTKAKAMKVLDMIQEAYCEFMAIRNGDMWCGKESVFQMPEDSEVEA
jgi:hypothetical protein